MNDLSDAQREFLALADQVDRVKGYSNIRSMFGGRDSMEEGIDELMDMNLINKKAHGVWEITDKGEDQVFSKVSCRNCNNTFRSIKEAEESSTMFCGHENLEYDLEAFKQ